MILTDISFLMQYVTFAAFSALRVFAIWDRNPFMTLLVLVLNLIPVATNLYAITQETITITVDPVFGGYCGFVLNIPAKTYLNCKFSLGTLLATMIAELPVLVLTWRKTYCHRQDAIKFGVNTPLSTLLLRDGTIYFAIFLVLNVIQLLVNTVPSLKTGSYVSNILSVLAPILISRFLLNLRQLGELENETQFNSRFSIPGFRVPTSINIVGNMGADLDHGFSEELDDGSEDGAPNGTLDAVSVENCSGTSVENIGEIQQAPCDIV